MEIKSITHYNIGTSECYSCEGRMELEDARKVVLADDSVVFVCVECCEVLAKVCGIEVITIDKPNVAECETCWIKYRCFTTRKAGFDDEDEDDED